MHQARSGSLALVLVVTVTASACTYHNARLDFRQLEQSGVYIAADPDLDEEARSFGEVEINKRFFYFASCSSVAGAAVLRLQEEASRRGGNLVSGVEFQNRNEWTTNPKCRRNLNWAWLVLPILLPVPQSVRIRGEAIFDPGFAGSAPSSQLEP
ncbi:hypothetical protein KJ059_04470 [Myxococcota bacterium]|nr:hypothetical protein [Myxococcota bacterium]MCZ7617281.1 hypothetical protein [Myxococcota bacterium]